MFRKGVCLMVDNGDKGVVNPDKASIPDKLRVPASPTSMRINTPRRPSTEHRLHPGARSSSAGPTHPASRAVELAQRGIRVVADRHLLADR